MKDIEEHDIDVPARLDGLHCRTDKDIHSVVNELLAHNAGLNAIDGERLDFPNSGEIVIYEKQTAIPTLRVAVPLPYLDAANVSTDDVEAYLALVSPGGVNVEVAIASPPDNE